MLLPLQLIFQFNIVICPIVFSPCIEPLVASSFSDLVALMLFNTPLFLTLDSVVSSSMSNILGRWLVGCTYSLVSSLVGWCCLICICSVVLSGLTGFGFEHYQLWCMQWNEPFLRTYQLLPWHNLLPFCVLGRAIIKSILMCSQGLQATGNILYPPLWNTNLALIQVLHLKTYFPTVPNIFS